MFNLHHNSQLQLPHNCSANQSNSEHIQHHTCAYYIRYLNPVSSSGSSNNSFASKSIMTSDLKVLSLVLLPLTLTEVLVSTKMNNHTVVIEMQEGLLKDRNLLERVSVIRHSSPHASLTPSSQFPPSHYLSFYCLICSTQQNSCKQQLAYLLLAPILILLTFPTVIASHSAPQACPVLLM